MFSPQSSAMFCTFLSPPYCLGEIQERGFSLDMETGEEVEPRQTAVGTFNVRDCKPSGSRGKFGGAIGG